MADTEYENIRAYLLTLKNAPPAPIEEQRVNLDRLLDTYLGHPVPLPEGTRVEEVTVAGVPGEWISSPNADLERVLLYFHGGAYMLGSCASHRDLVARLSAAAGVRGLLIEYRLAPEHIFPAGLEDALSVYRWLLANGTQPEHIVIAGDSAGGGLTLAFLTALRDSGEPLPAGAVCLSPWTDLMATGESLVTRADADPWLSPASLGFVAQVYAGETDIHNPLISPVYADLQGFPPLLIHVGGDEILLSDSTRVVEHAQTAGVDVQFHVWDGMWHVFQAFAPVLPTGQQAIEEIGDFIRRQTSLA